MGGSASAVVSSELLSLRPPGNGCGDRFIKPAPHPPPSSLSLFPFILRLVLVPGSSPAPAWPTPWRVRLRPVSTSLKQPLLDCREEDERLSSPCIGDHERVRTQRLKDLVPGCCGLGAERVVGPQPRTRLGKQRASRV